MGNPDGGGVGWEVGGSVGGDVGGNVGGPAMESVNDKGPPKDLVVCKVRLNC